MGGKTDEKEDTNIKTKETKKSDFKPNSLATQVLAISIPRGLSVNVDLRGDELKKDDLAKIKSQFSRWIEGLGEAFE